MKDATQHSIQRMKERRGINRKATEKRIEQAISRGKKADDFSSWERNFLQKEEYDNCTAIAYDGYCYIISERGACVTLYQLPKWFGKKKHFDGKVRIRNFKKYNRSHLCA